MTQIELQNLHEALVISLGFSIEFSLAMMLFLGLCTALFILFAIPARNHHAHR